MKNRVQYSMRSIEIYCIVHNIQYIVQNHRIIPYIVLNILYIVQNLPYIVQDTIQISSYGEHMVHSNDFRTHYDRNLVPKS